MPVWMWDGISGGKVRVAQHLLSIPYHDTSTPRRLQQVDRTYLVDTSHGTANLAHHAEEEWPDYPRPASNIHGRGILRLGVAAIFPSLS
jgi:hypothetical protein